MIGSLLLLVAGWTALTGWLDMRQLFHLKRIRADGAPAGWNVQAFERAIAIGSASAALSVAGTLVEGGLVAVLIGGGVAALDAWWSGSGLPTPVAAAMLIVSARAGRSAVRLVRRAAIVFAVDQRFGLNRITPVRFLVDAGRQALLSAFVILPLGCAVVALMEHGGPLWWFWVWALWYGLAIARAWLAPMLPPGVFERDAPLADAVLASRLAVVLAGCGLHTVALRVAYTSHRSARANAGVLGLGRISRIRLHDTLLARLDPREVEAVVAHEAGHMHHRHMMQHLAAQGMVGLAAVAALDMLGPAMGASTGERLTLFMLVLPMIGLVARPVMVSVRRRWEFQADAFAARLVGAEALAGALSKLYTLNSAVPSSDPLHAAFHATHPDPCERLCRLNP